MILQIKRKYKDNQSRLLEIICGYDEKLDYVFMCMYHKEEIIYDNLELENALEIQDFTIFYDIALSMFGIDLKKEMKIIKDYIGEIKK